MEKEVGNNFSAVINKLNFNTIRVIYEPPGIGRGLIGSNSELEKIYIYTLREEAIFDSTMQLQIDDFKNKKVGGIAVLLDSGWIKYGKVVEYYHK